MLAKDQHVTTSQAHTDKHAPMQTHKQYMVHTQTYTYNYTHMLQVTHSLCSHYDFIVLFHLQRKVFDDLANDTSQDMESEILSL